MRAFKGGIVLLFLALALTGSPRLAPPDLNAPAVPIKIVEATYSDEAKRAKYSVDVFLTVTVNTYGNLRNVRICRPAGLGLDEEALRAIRLWKFRPARRDGVPISTELLIEVSFRPGQETTSKVVSKMDLPAQYGDSE